MRVICIDDKLLGVHPKIHFGKYYTIEDIETFMDLELYILEEVKQIASDGCRFSYHNSRFAFISNIDETELIKEREEQLIKI